MTLIQDTQLSANRQIEERQGNFFSSMFISPVQAIRYSLMGPVAVGMGAYAAATGQIFTPFPFVFLPSPFLQPTLRKALGVQAHTAKAQALSAITGGGLHIGQPYHLISNIQGQHKRDALKAFRSTVRELKWKKVKGEQFFDNFADVFAAKAKARGTDVTPGAWQRFSTKKFKTAAGKKSILTHVGTAKLGAVVGTMAAGITLGYAAGRGAEFLFKTAVNAVESITAIAEHARALEFGGTLGAGYQTQEAATERQRALKMIQRNHLSGRRALGLEAQNYSALV